MMSDSPRLASSHSDHRRGVVLGLTMAEVLMLLLFILMLALIRALQLKEAQFRDVMEAMAPPAGPISDTTARALKEKLTSLVRDSESQKIRLDDFDMLQTAAIAFDPNAPPAATLKKALEDFASKKKGKIRLQTSMGELEKLENRAKAISPEVPPAATLSQGLDQVESLREVAAKDPNSLMANPTAVRDIDGKAREMAPESKPVDTVRDALTQAALRTSQSKVKSGTSVRDVVVAVRDKEKRLGARLHDEFSRDLETWKASLDENNLALRFENPDLLFEAGKADLRPEFQRFLNDFFPRYIAKLAEFKDDIEEVRIEGHTSSEWRGTADELETYFNNMKLSQDRTRAVLAYGMKTDIDPEMRDWGRSTITANGLASSRLKRLADGREDQRGSRRVEFRVLMKLHEGVMQVVDAPEAPAPSQ